MAKVLRTTHDDGTITEIEFSGVPHGLEQVERFVRGLSLGELRELVMELVEDFDPVAHRVETRAARATDPSDVAGRDHQAPAPSLLAQELEDAVIEALEDLDLDPGRWARDFFSDYSSHGSGLDGSLARIERHLDRGQAADTRGALELVIRELSDLDLDEVDDHDGSLGDALQRAVDLYARACASAPPAPEELAAWHLALRMTSLDADAPLAAFVPALGEEGLVVYRDALAQAEKAALPSQQDEVARLCVELADVDGDVDRAVELLQRGEPDTVGICRRLAAAGRDEEAIEWGRRVESQEGLAFIPRSDHFLDVAMLADCYVRLGRRDEALDLVRREFTRQPAWSTFAELGSYADRFGLGESERQWARDEAVRIATTKKGTGDAVVEIALGEGDHDAAWVAADRFGAQWMMERLAKSTSETHPARAAAFFRSQVDAMLTHPHAPVYPHAAELLVQIGELQAAAGTRSEWESYVRDLRERYRNRPALRRELDKAHLPS
jgi:tetratricopeptide (TPR) repeat protein